MTLLLTISCAIDRTNEFIGRAAAFLVLAAILVSTGNAISRKAFSVSSNAWLELQWYLFGAVFMLGAAWTLCRNEHVRIDILSSMFSRRARHIVDLLGHLVFLLPFVLIHIYFAAPYFLRSFRSGEVSLNYGGLIVWPAKLIILVGFVLLFLQGISELIKHVAVMCDILPDPSLDKDEHPAPGLG